MQLHIIYVLILLNVWLELSHGFAKDFDTCNPAAVRNTFLDCVWFENKYIGGPQWAVCANAEDLRRNSDYMCSSILRNCWVSCMEITSGKYRSTVSENCHCNRSVHRWTINQSLDPKCYLPFGTGCSWFSDCLGKYKQCPRMSNLDPFGRYFCKVFEDNSEKLSSKGRQYITSLQNCLKRKLYHLILPSSNETCSQRTDIARRAHSYCFGSGSLTEMFCELPDHDQCNIFWTTKSIITKTFDRSARKMLDPMRTCYRGNAQSAEKQLLITFNSTSDDVQTRVDTLAHQLDWQSMDIVWDGQRLSQISDSVVAIDILLKPSYELDFTYRRQARSVFFMSKVMARVIIGLHGMRWLFIEVMIRAYKSDYFSGIGECPNNFDNRGMFSWFVPESLEKINVRFVLHRKQRNWPQNKTVVKETLDYFNNDSIINSEYNGSQRTYFITHGFISSGETKWVKKMTSSLLKQEDCNVIVVDWGEGADFPLDSIAWAVLSGAVSVLARYPPAALFALGEIAKVYVQSAVNTRLVGCLLGKLMEKLKMFKQAEYSKMHSIGHSLGAHVSGFAGAYIKMCANAEIGRVTGLDPAGPGFKKVERNFRLDETDAAYVDIIHTDTVLFGINKPIGNIDFYPGGGHRQPGCYYPGCSHERAYHLFIESINPTHECLACNCSRSDYDNDRCLKNGTCAKTATMGFKVDTTSSGSFYLNTNGASPFCTGRLPDRKRKKRMAGNSSNMMILHQRKQVSLRKRKKPTVDEYGRGVVSDLLHFTSN